MLKRSNTWPPSVAHKRHDTVRYEHTLRNAAFAGRGTPYPISDAELSVLQSWTLTHWHPAWRRPPLDCMTLPEAHATLESMAHVAFSAQQEAAHGRLGEAYSIAWDIVTPDLFIKVFNDPDSILFDSELHGRVHLTWGLPKWSGRRGQDWGACTLPVLRQYETSMRTVIALNARRLPHGMYGHAEEWHVLIHEMLHAYLCIMCESKAYREHTTCAPYGMDEARSHGPLLFKACHVLSWRLAFPELTPPDLFGYGRDLCRLPPLFPAPGNHLQLFEMFAECNRLCKQVFGERGDRPIMDGLDVIPGRRRHSISGRCLGVDRTDEHRGQRGVGASMLEIRAPQGSWRDSVSKRIRIAKENVRLGVDDLRWLVRWRR